MEINIIGKTFGRLTPLFKTRASEKHNWWMFKCSCGSFKEIRKDIVTCGQSKSCGCLNTELCADLGKSMRKHGLSKTKVWRAWIAMRTRCLNKSNNAFPRYGGRGISICKEWEAFECFYKDMGDPPTEKHSIDRINNDGNYEPSNCRWATSKEQANNRTNKYQCSNGHAWSEGNYKLCNNGRGLAKRCLLCRDIYIRKNTKKEMLIKER